MCIGELYTTGVQHPNSIPEYLMFPPSIKVWPILGHTFKCILDRDPNTAHSHVPYAFIIKEVTNMCIRTEDVR